MTDRPLAIVTGTTRGLGAALAEALLELDWDVHGVARGEAPATLESARAYAHHRCDLADVHSTRTLFEGEMAAVLRERSRLGLVNNAGVLDLEPIVDCELEHLTRSLTVNTAVPVWLYGWLLRFAPPTATMRIVDVSSGAADTPYPGWVAYCASKAGLDMAARVLAEEHREVEAIAGRDVAVVEFAPGVVDTGMQAQIRAISADRFPRRQKFVELHEQGRLVDPSAPAAGIAALLAADDLPPFSRRRFGG